MGALLALLVPFILTKRKITAHLRDVYESHKYKGYLKGVEERVIEERTRRQHLKDKQADAKEVDTDGKHHHHKKNDKKYKRTQIVPDANPRAPSHKTGKTGIEEFKESQQTSTPHTAS